MEPKAFRVPGVYIFLKVAGALGEKQTPGTGKGFTSFLREEGGMPHFNCEGGPEDLAKDGS
jgi:hypothetical protein